MTKYIDDWYEEIKEQISNIAQKDLMIISWIINGLEKANDLQTFEYKGNTYELMKKER